MSHGKSHTHPDEKSGKVYFANAQEEMKIRLIEKSANKNAARTPLP